MRLSIILGSLAMVLGVAALATPFVRIGNYAIYPIDIEFIGEVSKARIPTPIEGLDLVSTSMILAVIAAFSSIVALALDTVKRIGVGYLATFLLSILSTFLAALGFVKFYHLHTSFETSIPFLGEVATSVVKYVVGPGLGPVMESFVAALSLGALVALERGSRHRIVELETRRASEDELSASVDLL